MTHKLKVLGLALAAMFAFGAMTASGASAQALTTESGNPVTLLGTQTGGTFANSFTAFGGDTHCPNAKYTGHKVISQETTEADAEEPPEHEPVENGANEVTITPHYGVCTTNPTIIFVPNFITTVDMNGCDYDFELGATTGGEAGTYGVNAFVRCPKGKKIEITQFTNHTAHTSGTWFCKQTINHKAGAYTGLHATDTGNGHIDVTGTIKEISSTKSNPGSHSFLCPGETDEAAELHIDITVEDKTGADNISLSH